MTATTNPTSTIVIPDVGELAPDAIIQATSDRDITLSSLWEATERGLALVFLRYYGCPFCKEHAQAIEARRHEFRSAGIDVVFVGCGTVDEAWDFRESLGLSSPVYNDPDRDAYRAYGLGEASTSSMFNPRVIGGGVRAAVKGHLPGRSSGNPLQLQGQFLIDRQGIIRAAARPTLMSEIPSADALLRDALALKAAP